MEISLNEHDIIAGHLLGDGGLWQYKKHFRYCISNTHRDLVEQADLLLPNLSGHIYTRDRKPPRQTIYHYRCSSGRYKEYFEHLYKSFYVNSTKKNTIPDWLVPSPEMIYYMYIGDGCLSDRLQLDKRNGKLNRILRITISTYCFTNESIKTFFDKLGIHYVMDKKNVVIYNGKYARQFLSYIGPCRTISYAYKWKFIHDLLS